MEFELPFPPSANRYWRNVNGRMVKSAEARAYRDEAGYACLLQMYGKSRGRPLTGHIKAELDFYFPSERGDLDNRIKVMLDALQGLAFENDSQIREIVARRFKDKDRPRVMVQISASNTHKEISLS
jgi:crossover junction endodeoxyribonuclease RusA